MLLTQCTDPTMQLGNTWNYPVQSNLQADEACSAYVWLQRWRVQFLFHLISFSSAFARHLLVSYLATFIPSLETTAEHNDNFSVKYCLYNANTRWLAQSNNLHAIASPPAKKKKVRCCKRVLHNFLGWLLEQRRRTSSYVAVCGTDVGAPYPNTLILFRIHEYFWWKSCSQCRMLDMLQMMADIWLEYSTFLFPAVFIVLANVNWLTFWNTY